MFKSERIELNSIDFDIYRDPYKFEDMDLFSRLKDFYKEYFELSNPYVSEMYWIYRSCLFVSERIEINSIEFDNCIDPN